MELFLSNHNHLMVHDQSPIVPVFYGDQHQFLQLYWKRTLFSQVQNISRSWTSFGPRSELTESERDRIDRGPCPSRLVWHFLIFASSEFHDPGPFSIIAWLLQPRLQCPFEKQAPKFREPRCWPNTRSPNRTPDLPLPNRSLFREYCEKSKCRHVFRPLVPFGQQILHWLFGTTH